MDDAGFDKLAEQIRDTYLKTWGEPAYTDKLARSPWATMPKERKEKWIDMAHAAWDFLDNRGWIGAHN